MATDEPTRTAAHNPGENPPPPGKAPDTAGPGTTAEPGTTPQLPGEGATASGHAGEPGTVSFPDGDTLPAGVSPDVAGYHIEAEIARGGMGVVYKARHVRLNRPTALKMILGGRYQDPAARLRFMVEAEAIAQLQHPHVVPVYEFGQHDDMPFLAMEYVGGGTLAQKIARGGRFAPAAAAGLVVKLADAVAAAHSKGIVHRDLKPANVLLTESGEPKVTDFGLAKVGDSGVTASGAVMGTPSYMAPEQAAGKVREVGTRSDVYALGAILYELLTGKPPFRGDTPMATIQMVLGQDPPRPRAAEPRIPGDLETICLKCLEKDPARRYPTADALGADLRAFLEGRPIAARPVGRVERVVKWARRHPASAGLLGVFLGALAVLVAVWLSFSLELRDRNADLSKALGDLGLKTGQLEQANAEIATANKGLIDKTKEAEHNAGVAQAQTQIAKGESRAAEEAAGRALKALAASQRSDFAARLSQASLLAEREPEQALALLEDPQFCPPQLRDFTWGMIHTACSRALFSVRAAPGAEGDRLLIDTSNRGFGTADGEALFLDDVLVTIAPAEKGGRRVRRFDAAGEFLGETIIPGAHVTTPDRRTIVEFDPAKKHGRRWDVRAGREAGDWTLAAHRGPVIAHAWSEDLLTLATLNDAGRVYVWDAVGSRLRQEIQGAEEGLTHLAVSPAGDRVATFERDKTDPQLRVVRVWDAGTGKEVRALEGGVWPPARTAFSPDGRLLAVAGDGRRTAVTVHDLTTGKPVPLPSSECYMTEMLTFNPEGQTLVHLQRDEGMVSGEGTSHHTLRVWDVTRREGRILQQATTANVYAFLSPDKRRVAFGWLNGMLIFDTQTGRSITRPGEPREKLKPIAFSPDSRTIVTTGLKLWDVDSGRELLTLRGAGPVAFSADGRRLATQTGRKVFTVWDVVADTPFGRQLPWNEAVLSAAVAPNGRTLAVLGGDMGGFPSVRQTQGLFLDLVTGERRGTITNGALAPIGYVAFSPDGRRLASDWNWQVELWDRNGAARPRIDMGQGFPAMAFSPDGREFAATGQRGLMFRPVDGGPGASFPAEAPLNTNPAYSRDGKLVAAGSLRGHVWVWDRADGRRRESPEGHRAAVVSVAVSPDGSLVASAGADSTVRVWNTSDNSVLTLRGQGGKVGAVAFAPDGSTVVSGGDDGTVRFWDPTTGQLRGNFRRHTFPVSVLSFSPDGTSLVSGSAGRDKGGELLVWRGLARREELATFADKDPVAALMFSPDGKEVVSLATTGGLHRWNLANRQLAETPAGPNPAAGLREPSKTVEPLLGFRLDAGGKIEAVFRRAGDNRDELYRWREVGGEQKLFNVPRPNTGYLAGPVLRPAFSADGGVLAQASLLGGPRDPLAPPGNPKPVPFVLTRKDLKTGEEKVLLDRPGLSWRAASPDGRWVALQGAKDKASQLLVFDVAKAAVAWELPLVGTPVVSFSPESDLVLVSVGFDGAKKAYRADTGEEAAAPTQRIAAPDGKHYLVAARTPRGQSLTLHDAATDKPLGALALQRERGEPVFTPDGKTLLVVDGDFQFTEVVAWNLADPKQQVRFNRRQGGAQTSGFTIRLPATTVGLVPVSDSLVLELDSHGELTAWDLARMAVRDGVRLPASSGHRWALDANRAPVVTPDRKTLILPADDGTCQLWDTETWKLRKVIDRPGGALTGVRLTPDGKTLVVTDPQAVRLCDPATGAVRHTIAAKDRIERARLTPDGRSVLVQETKTMSVHAVEDGKELASFAATPAAPYAPEPVFGPGGDNLLYYRSGFPTVAPEKAEYEVLVAMPDGPPASRFKHPDRITALAVSPDGRRAASAGLDRVVRVWDAATGAELVALQGHAAEVSFVRFLGEALVSGDAGEVVVWDPEKQAPRHRLRGHTDRIRAAALSPDGRLLAAGGDDLAVYVWDVGSGRLLGTFRGHHGPVNDVAFSPDGRMFASGSFDGVVKVWGVPTPGGAPAAAEADDTAGPVVYSGDGKTLFVGRADGTIRAIDVATKAGAPFAGRHSGGVLSLALSPDRTTLASGGADGRVKLWDVAGRKEKATWEGPGGPLYAVAFSPNGKTLAYAEGRPLDLFGAPRRGLIVVRDLASGEVTAELRGHTDGVRRLAFSPGGTVLASASDDNSVRLWDAAGWTLRRTLWHRGPVWALAFGPRNVLFTGGHDATTFRLDQFGARSVTQPLRAWDAATGAELASFPVGGDTVRGLELSADGATLAVSEADGSVSLWEVATRHGVALFRAHKPVTDRVAWSPDGKSLATAGADGTLRVWDVASLRGREVPAAPSGPFAAVAVTPKGDLAAVIEERPTGAELRLLETTGGKERAAVAIDKVPAPPGWPGRTYLFRATPEAAGIAFTAQLPLEFRLTEFDPASSADRVTYERPPFPLAGLQPLRWALAVSPDGAKAAVVRVPPPQDRDPLNPRPPVAVPDAVVTVWDLKAGKPGPLLKGHKGRVSALAFGPDGKVLATAGDDHVIRLWDVVTGEERKLEGHTAAVRSLRFSSDGALLAAGDESQSLRLWDVKTGKEAAALSMSPPRPPRTPVPGVEPPANAEPRAVPTAAFAPDGKTLATLGLTWPRWSPRSGDPLAMVPSAAARAVVPPRVRGWAVTTWDLAPVGDGKLMFRERATLAKLPYAGWLGGYDADGRTLFVALGSVLYAHDAASGRVLAHLPIRQGTDVPAAGAALGSVAQDEEPGSWAAQVVTLDVKTMQARKLVTAGLVPGFSTRPAASADGSRVVTYGLPKGDGAGPVQVWDTAGAKPAAKVEPRHALGDGAPAVRGVAVTADGKVAAVTDRAGKVVLYETETGKALHTLEAGGAASASAFSGNGELFAAASGSDESAVRVWEVETGKELTRFGAGKQAVTALAFAADNQWLATGSSDGWVQVWGAGSGTRRTGWKAHERAVQALAFEPGGDGLVSGGAENAVQAWDVATGKPRWQVVKRYRSAVLSLGLSADGKRLVICVEAGVQVVQVADGAVVTQAQGEPVYSASFTPDGSALVMLTVRRTPDVFKGTLRVTAAGSLGRPAAELPPEP